MAGHLSLGRIDKQVTGVFEESVVLLRDGVEPHPGIHRGRNHNRLGGGANDGCEQVIGNTRGHLAQEIGRSRSDNKQVGPLGHIDMPGADKSLFWKKLRRYRVLRNSFKGKWSDEFGGGLSHNDAHRGTFFNKKPHQVWNLITSDSSSEAD